MIIDEFKRIERTPEMHEKTIKNVKLLREFFELNQIKLEDAFDCMDCLQVSLLSLGGMKWEEFLEYQRLIAETFKSAWKSHEKTN